LRFNILCLPIGLINGLNYTLRQVKHSFRFEMFDLYQGVDK